MNPSVFHTRFLCHHARLNSFASRHRTRRLVGVIISCDHTTDFYLGNSIYLGQIHQKSPEVDSSRVLFYLGEKFWKGHTTDIGS